MADQTSIIDIIRIEGVQSVLVRASEPTIEGFLTMNQSHAVGIGASTALTGHKEHFLSTNRHMKKTSFKIALEEVAQNEELFHSLI